MTLNQKLIGLAFGAIMLVAATAVTASYVTRNSVAAEEAKAPAKIEKIRPTKVVASAQPAEVRCDDKNIVGTIGGGAAGIILGSQLGKGSGKTAATVAGALGGAYLGNEFLPTRNVTCR